MKSAGGKLWEFTAVYMSPNPSVRRHLWAELDGIHVSNPWLLACDFNCVLRDDKRSSMTGASSYFQSWVQEGGFIDMGFIGARYTWSHGNDLETRRMARLDRALCCAAWRRDFPLATVRHLCHSHSDHCPVLVEVAGMKTRRLGARPFRFQAAWLIHA